MSLYIILWIVTFFVVNDDPCIESVIASALFYAIPTVVTVVCFYGNCSEEEEKYLWAFFIFLVVAFAVAAWLGWVL